MLQYNADLLILDDMGRSALWHAQTSGALDCVSILLNAGVDPSFGMPNNSACAQLIAGSLSSRECCTDERLKIGGAKLRRQSDIVRRISPNHLSGTSNVGGFHQRASDAFERLPASVL